MRGFYTATGPELPIVMQQRAMHIQQDQLAWLQHKENAGDQTSLHQLTVTSGAGTPDTRPGIAKVEPNLKWKMKRKVYASQKAACIKERFPD
eukprot:91376-Pelagomonas_calceolata.AAC.9